MSKHERDRRHDAKRRAEKPWRNLYKRKEWLEGRELHLTKHPLCAWCLQKGRIVPAKVVHHKVPHQGNEALFYDPDNWESLCKPCHDGAAQQQERIGYSQEVGTDGWPVDPKHPVNRKVTT